MGLFDFLSGSKKQRMNPVEPSTAQRRRSSKPRPTRGESREWLEITNLKDPHSIIKRSRNFLARSTNIMDRHFVYNAYEKALYKLRDTPGVLDEFDSTCERHLAELPRMKHGLFSQGKIAVVPIFKQMAIRKEKSGDVQGAIVWCERGLSFYAGKCTKKDYEDGLRKKLILLKKKSEN